MKPFSITWTVEQQHDGMLLRDFLRVEKQISKKALAEIKFAGGFLFVNEKEVTARHVLEQGDRVKVIFPIEKPSEAIKKQNIPFHIVYEDDHLLVINKEANMPTIPTLNHLENTLANAVLYYYEQKQIGSTFHAVNRLDKDTSGLLIVAKHRYAHDLMTKQQREGNVKRQYIAIVHGVMELEQGTIAMPIARKEDSIIERVISEDGQMAVTHFRVVRKYDNRTVVSIELETGRTHQIRVHFSAIGHPLLGDDLYGGKTDEMKRQALHSYRCTFYHPLLQKELTFTQDVPEDMKKYM